MSQHPIMEKLAAKLQRKDIPDVKPGDSVRVQVKIKEGDKERVQAFEGTVISMRSGPQGSFTVRKVSFGQGVERIFPFNSKVLDKVEIVRSNQVRRAKLFYLRALKGKAARLREVDHRAVAAKAEAAETAAQANNFFYTLQAAGRKFRSFFFSTLSWGIIDDRPSRVHRSSWLIPSPPVTPHQNFLRERIIQSLTARLSASPRY